MDRLEELNGSLFVSNKMILKYCPYPFELKRYLETISFPSKEEAIQSVLEHYKESELYEQFVVEGKQEEEMKLEMVANVELRHSELIPFLERTVERSILLCRLVDYIGNYPATWPVPKKSEQIEDLEKLLEEYDIIVRYHMGKQEDLLLSSDDIQRVVGTLDNNLMAIRLFFSDPTIFMKPIPNETEYKEGLADIEKDLVVPISSDQKEGHSRRQEGLHYLVLQHGDLSQYQ